MKLKISLASVSLSAAYHRGQVYYDNERGKGAIPYNAEIDYKGIRVMMRPSMYLSLCKPLIKGQAEATNFEFLKEYIKGGNPIGAPWLYVDLPHVNGAFTTDGARIAGHEGRNRTLAIMELYGDHPMEVHITTSTGSKRYFTSEMREAIRKGIRGERGSIVNGPLWEEEL